MHFTAILCLLSSALTAFAQTAGADNSDTAAAAANELLLELNQLPTCATTCIATALPNSSCDPSDFACLCTDEAYITFSETCILSNCTIKGSLSAQAWQKKACQAPVRNRGPLTRRIGTALIIISAVLIGLRFIARWRIQNTSIGWDDWTILLAWLGLIPSTAIVQLMTYKGMGRDIWTVPFDDITQMLRYFYIEQYIYQLVIVATKISIVLLYLRIFPKEVSKRFQYISWGVIAGLLAYGTGFCIYFAVQCRPISYFWNQWDGEHEGVCLDTQTAIYVNSAFNIFFDLVVFFLPVPKLIALQVRDTRRKVGVILTFLVGLFVTICSIVRLKYLSNLDNLTNATYNYNDIALWSGLEGDVGVLCACMPTIAGPVLYFFREKIGSKLSSYAKSSSSKSPNVSRITGDKSITRLPSSAGSHEDVELGPGPRTSKHGGIEKTTVTSMYNLPQVQASGDDEKLIGGHDQMPGGRHQWEV